MILRIWHGWTSPSDATAYEQLLRDEIFPEIAEMTGEGYLGHEIGRREDEKRVEYVTIIRFESWEDVEAFAGPNPEHAHVPDEAKELLVDHDSHVKHYRVRDREDGVPP
ncbi:MAG: antibiotic biosynthesis monooxygenase [Halobacteriaceae archaeon]